MGDSTGTQKWLHMVLVVLIVALLTWSCAAKGDDASVLRGEYLTTILGCAGCHTEGGIEGKPHGAWLAGSSVGIAYTDFDDRLRPGIVFPANLTADPETGLGEWSSQEIARAIRYGVNHKGTDLNNVMPWINYSLLNDQDTQDIVDYLQSLRPIKHKVPEAVAKGEQTELRYVRIGIFRFEPTTSTEGKLVNDRAQR